MRLLSKENQRLSEVGDAAGCVRELEENLPQMNKKRYRDRTLEYCVKAGQWQYRNNLFMYSFLLFNLPVPLAINLYIIYIHPSFF
jgi:hypothetical protein